MSVYKLRVIFVVIHEDLKFFSVYNSKTPFKKGAKDFFKYFVKLINPEFTFILNTKALHLADGIEVVQQRMEA